MKGLLSRLAARGTGRADGAGPPLLTQPGRSRFAPPSSSHEAWIEETAPSYGLSNAPVTEHDEPRTSADDAAGPPERPGATPTRPFKATSAVAEPPGTPAPLASNVPTAHTVQDPAEAIAPTITPPPAPGIPGVAPAAAPTEPIGPKAPETPSPVTPPIQSESLPDAPAEPAGWRHPEPALPGEPSIAETPPAPPAVERSEPVRSVLLEVDTAEAALPTLPAAEPYPETAAERNIAWSADGFA